MRTPPFVRTGLALLAALLLCGARGAYADGAGRAELLLRQSTDAPKTVSYIGQLQTVRFSSNGAAATLTRVEHKAPSFTRRWYLAPEALYGDYVITRGAQTYRFNVKHARVVVSTNAHAQDGAFTNDRLDLLLRNYRPVLEEVENTTNRPAASVVLINRYTGERMMRLWIDAQTHLILREETFHENGAVASQTRFEAIRYTNNIPDDIFAVQTPSGFTRTEGYSAEALSSDISAVVGEAGFKPYTPKDLPQGFVLVGGNIANAQGVKTLHLIYTDGLRTVSLFENDKGAAANFGDLRPRVTHFEGHEGRYIEDGSTTLLTWAEHDLHFALAGDLGHEELRQIAVSVVP